MGYFLMTGCHSIAGEGVPNLSVIPKPVKLERVEGDYSFDEKTKIVITDESEELSEIGMQMAEKLRVVTGYPFELLDESDLKKAKNVVKFTLDSKLCNLGREGYQLNVSPDSVHISAPGAAGIFYGIQSLYQLMPEAVESGRLVEGIDWSMPCVRIEDRPRFRWRGMHLDVCRHFFPVEFIKKYIDLMTMYKLNTFHWHLTEDQGWRIEITRYPKLTEIGSIRKETMGDGKSYGGSYTQKEIREVVEYARQRFITVVPEIEMPGHSMAALAAYPDLSCTGGPFEVATRWGVYEDVYCAGSEKTFEFLEHVLAEVIALFPGPFMHTGGDECPKVRWEHCERCQRRMRDEGLKDEHELQSYFIKRIEKFLNSKGKKLIGWDEILEGGLTADATVMSWRGMEGGIEAAKSGHDAVMSPTSHCYFDFYQAKSGEPKAIGGYLPLEKVYSFEPTPSELTEEESNHILGAQANVWTEYMDTAEHVEYMLLPRMCALSEVVWSGKEHRDYEDFTRRMADQYERFEVMHVNFRPPDGER